MRSLVSRLIRQTFFFHSFCRLYCARPFFLVCLHRLRLAYAVSRKWELTQIQRKHTHTHTNMRFVHIRFGRSSKFYKTNEQKNFASRLNHQLPLVYKKKIIASSIHIHTWDRARQEEEEEKYETNRYFIWEKFRFDQSHAIFFCLGRFFLSDFFFQK